MPPPLRRLLKFRRVIVDYFQMRPFSILEGGPLVSCWKLNTKESLVIWWRVCLLGKPMEDSNEILNREEIACRQNSRSLWLKEGDKTFPLWIWKWKELKEFYFKFDGVEDVKTTKEELESSFVSCIPKKSIKCNFGWNTFWFLFFWPQWLVE